VWYLRRGVRARAPRLPPPGGPKVVGLGVAGVARAPAHAPAPAAPPRSGSGCGGGVAVGVGVVVGRRALPRVLRRQRRLLLGGWLVRHLLGANKG